MNLQQLNQINYKIKFKADLNILFNKRSEYIPLFSINKLNINKYVYQDVKNPIFKTLNLNVSNKINEIPYQNIINKPLGFEISSENLHFVKSFLEVNKEKLYDYVNDKSMVVSNYVSNNNHYTYEHMFSGLQNENIWQISNLKSNTYLCNFGFISIFNRNEDFVEFRPIMCFMIKSEHLKYHRLCHLTNKPLDTSLVELWIEKGFEDKESEFKLLKMQYKKFLKPYVIANKIKVVEVENLEDKLFTKIKQPNFKTIKERNLWLDNINLDFINHEAHMVELKNKGIKLIYE